MTLKPSLLAKNAARALANAPPASYLNVIVSIVAWFNPAKIHKFFYSDNTVEIK
jgi:hypothetical protein